MVLPCAYFLRLRSLHLMNTVNANRHILIVKLIAASFQSYWLAEMTFSTMGIQLEIA